ncbi:MAG: GldG family protein [Elusimicrobia bacterium]|nr:GldG family protein [Elusimicrobiota bacterium]
MDRRTLLKTSSKAAMLVIGIAMLLNVFAHFAHLRLDLSQGKVYSMSGATKRLVRGLPDPVTIKLFSSRELPPQVAASRDYARDLLKEYRASSNGKVRVQFIDTDADPKHAQEAGKEGIAPVRFDIYSRDRFEQREGFLGISLQFREKKEGIPFLQEVTGLEYDLTSRIRTMTLPSRPAIAFVTNHRAQSVEALDPNLRQKLETRYTLRTLDLDRISDDGIPADVQTVLLLGPEERLPEKHLWLLDQFLLSGRSLGVAFDTKRVDMRSFTALENETGLPEFLAKHGVKVVSSIVLDEQSQPIQISVQQGYFAITNVVQFPPFVKATGLSDSHPVTKGLDSIIVPFGSPLELTGDAAAKGTLLVKSSPYSWARPDKQPVSLHPFRMEGPRPDDMKGPFGLAAAIETEFSPALATAPKGMKPKAPLAKAARPGRLAVVGTSRVMSPSYRVPAANYAFMLNLMDWLALDAELIAIRNKAVAFRPLREIPAGRKALIRYTLIFVPPLLAVAGGLWRWRARRVQRDRRVAAYGTPPPAPPPPAQPSEPVGATPPSEA